MRVEDVLITEKSKLNFLKGIIRLSKCDGIVDEEEKNYIDQVALGFDLSDSSKKELEQCWNMNNSIEIKFETSIEKNFFLIQCIQLSWIDGNYSEEEQREIRKIAVELGVLEDSIVKIEKWVEEGLEWNKRGEKLLEL